MNAWRFILASLRHYRRIHLAVALGVAVATAVLTGALLVGDSVRGSLRDLTLQRLGTIDSAIVAPHMFRAELASEVAGDAAFKKYFSSAQPAILLNGTLQAAVARMCGGRRRFRWSVASRSFGRWAQVGRLRRWRMMSRRSLNRWRRN